MSYAYNPEPAYIRAGADIEAYVAQKAKTAEAYPALGRKEQLPPELMKLLSP